MMADRTEIVRIIGDMLDTPDEYGLFHTSTAYTELELYINKVRYEALGATYAYLCIRADAGDDCRVLEVPECIDAVIKALRS